MLLDRNVPKTAVIDRDWLLLFESLLLEDQFVLEYVNGAEQRYFALSLVGVKDFGVREKALAVIGCNLGCSFGRRDFVISRL